MTSAEALQLLVDAKDDNEKIALASVEIAVSSQPTERQASVREAIFAAAVPHWFDEKILAAILDISPNTASELCAVLNSFSFVEAFPRYHACNIHERTRSHLLAFLNREDKQKYDIYSARSAAYFQTGTAPHERIEAAYHQLIAAPEAGAQTIATLYDQWKAQGAWEILQALAAPLDEHIQFHRLQDAALAMTLGVVAASRAPYQSLAQNELLLNQAAEIFAQLGDSRRRGATLTRLGTIQQARGDLAGAQRSFEESMEIFKKLAELHPENAACQRDLSIGHNKLGIVQQTRGDLAGAQRSFEADMEIAKKLAEGDPGNEGWQRDLVVSHIKLGEIQQARDDLAGAQRSFEVSMEISKQLADRDPQNTDWQRDLSICHTKLGNLRQARGDLAAAQSSFEADMQITKKLAQRDPENTEWQHDLCISHVKLGHIQETRGDLRAAEHSFNAGMEITKRLAERDPENIEWLRSLAACYFNLSRLCRALEKWDEAQQWAKADLAIAEKLAEHDPANDQWQQRVELRRRIVADLQDGSRSRP
jgi:tetratricopeptide (TPR) repeat protein